MKIASRIEDKDIKAILFSLLDYLIEVISTAENSKTLENDLHVIYSVLTKNPNQFNYIAENILKEILNFMLKKPKYRLAVQYT
jgi:hypothetical protein